MPSKLTFHIMGFDDNVLDLVQEMHPSCVKLLDFPSDTNVDAIRQLSPGTLIVNRTGNDLDKDYSRPADDFFNSPTFQDAFNKLRGRGVIFEGLNEPIIATAADAQKLAAWYVRFAQLVHVQGEKCAAFSFSTGNPKLELVPLLADAARACDYIALHEYLDPNTNGSGFARYRDFIAAIPAPNRKPIIITECGADDGNNHGWLTYYTPNKYMDILKAYDVELLKDPYVVGATIFQYGAGGDWAKFEIKSIGKRIADYVASTGGGAFPLPTSVTLPAQPGEPSPSIPSGPPPPTVTPVPSTPSPAITLYVVQFSDNLTTIAKKFNVTMQAIINATNATAATDSTFKVITNPRLIKPGQKLVIPSIPVPSSPTLGTATSTPTTTTLPISTPPVTPGVTVHSVPGGDLALRDYPRPAQDNGMGIHWGLDSRTETVARFIPLAQQLKFKWALFYPENPDLAREGVKKFVAAGILPVIRPKVLVDQQNVKWSLWVQAARDGGIPTPYIQIFNEPSDDREWNSGHLPANYAGKWSTRWLDAANQVLGAGGLPGVQCLDQEAELRALIQLTRNEGRVGLWKRAWFCPHSYPLNHPPGHPYDDVHQKGTPVSAAEFAKHKWRGLFDEVNQHRADDKKPGQTVREVEESLLTYKNFQEVFQQELGFVPPMIVGEGGWAIDSSDDIRYPTIDEELHAGYFGSWYQWFSAGMNSLNEPLPDFLFAVCPWLLYDFSATWAAAWTNNVNGIRQKTIDTVSAMPSFVRRFSWDG